MSKSSKKVTETSAVEAHVEAPVAVETPAKPKAKRYASLSVLANPNATISYLAPIESTGKKQGTLTYRKYSLFQQGMSIAQVEAKFVENNWPRMKARNQLRWDIEHGFVQLEAPQS